MPGITGMKMLASDTMMTGSIRFLSANLTLVHSSFPSGWS